MGKIVRIIFVAVALVAVLLTAAYFLAPRFLDHEAAPVAGARDGGAIVLAGAALGAPDTSPGQEIVTTPAGTLRLTVLADQPDPTPAEQGARVLLMPETAALIENKSVMAEVRFTLPAAAAASGLALSIQGIGPATWVRQEISPQSSVARFELPPQLAAEAIGVRALSTTAGQTGAVEISEIRLTPAP